MSVYKRLGKFFKGKKKNPSPSPKIVQKALVYFTPLRCELQESRVIFIKYLLNIYYVPSLVVVSGTQTLIGHRQCSLGTQSSPEERNVWKQMAAECESPAGQTRCIPFMTDKFTYLHIWKENQQCKCVISREEVVTESFLGESPGCTGICLPPNSWEYLCASSLSITLPVIYPLVHLFSVYLNGIANVVHWPVPICCQSQLR